MKVTLSEFSAVIKSRDWIAFGAGNIASKTINKADVDPAFLVDNSASYWGIEYQGLNVKKPDVLLEAEKKPFIVICTTSIAEVSHQLDSYGYVAGEDYIVSPVLNDWMTVREIEKAEVDLLLTSGLSSSGLTGGNGGVYKISIKEDGVSHEQIHVGSSHGILKCREAIYFVDDDLGIVELSQDLKIVRNVELPKRTRGHGLAWSEERSMFYVACSGLDQVLEYDYDFKPHRRLNISTKSLKGSWPHHHMNDCAVRGDSIYLSMFSVTGNWKADSFDGGILEIDLDSGQPIGVLKNDLYMPHNIMFRDGSLTILDSLRGRLLSRNYACVGEFPAFARGLAWDDEFTFVGQSRNRNFSSVFGLSNNISIDSGVVVFDPKTKLSKFAQLPRSITEIHGLLVL